MSLLQYFSPTIIEQVESKYSGTVKVTKIFNSYYLATGFWTQSGGLIYDLWGDTLKKFRPQKSSSWLILGLSGGTAAQIISKRFHPSKIVGVEIDPVMVELGKKYLGLDNIPNLEIVIQDANRYLQTTGDKFDNILVDLYIGDIPPQFIYSPKFLKRLKILSTTCIINHLFYTPEHKIAAGSLIKKLEEVFTSIRLQRKLTNLMIICS